MKLLGITKDDVDKKKDGEYVPKLESLEVALIHCNLVNNRYYQASKMLFTLYLINNLLSELLFHLIY